MLLLHFSDWIALDYMSIVYIDDILVFSATVEEHLERLRNVLDHLKNSGLKIKPGMCNLMRKSKISWSCGLRTWN